MTEGERTTEIERQYIELQRHCRQTDIESEREKEGEREREREGETYY